MKSIPDTVDEEPGIQVSDRKITVLLAAFALVISGLYAWILLDYTGGEWALPLDDSYIYLQYARNLANGHFLQFNAGDPPTTGTTSILYPVFLALGYLAGFRQESAFVLFSFLLNAAFLCGSTVLAFQLLRRSFSSHVSAASAVFFLLTGASTWGFHSGMEIGMLVFLALLAMKAVAGDLERGTGVRSAVCLSLLTIARPEGLFYAILIATGWWVFSLKGKLHNRPWPLLGIFLTVALYLAVNYRIGGSWMPNSGRPKSPYFTPYFSVVFVLQHCANFMLFVMKGILAGTFTEDLIAPQNRVDDLTFFPPFSIILFVLGAAQGISREWKRRVPGPGALLSLWFLSGFVFVSLASAKGQHHFRYLLPFLSAYSLLIIPGAFVFARAFAGSVGRLTARLLAVILCGGLLWFQALTTVNFMLLFGQAGYGFLPYKQIGIWARNTLPPDARMAALDVGYIGFYSHRPIFDLYGLVTREMVESTFFFTDVMGSKFEAMQKMGEKERPRYFFVQRSRFDEKGDEGHLAPLRSRQIYTIPTDYYPAIGLDPSIYEIDWSLAGRAALPHDPAIRTLLAARSMVDELNVADLDSHRAHNYRYIPPVPGVFAANRIVIADCADGQRVEEGAWGVLRGESFQVKAAARRPLLLVLRTNYIDGRLQVFVNGSQAGTILQQTPDPKKWYEIPLEIPADLVQDANTIEVDGRFMSAHYWFAQ